MNKILVISDNQALRTLLTSQEELEFIFIDNKEQVNQFDNNMQTGIALAIIDLQLPNNSKIIDFLTLKNLPIISLITNQPILAKIKNLTIMPKPISIGSLLNNITKMISDQELKTIDHQNCQINFQKRTVTKNDREIKLTELENNLLKYLINHNNKISKNNLLTEIWSYKNLENINDTGTVEVTLNKLKKKLKEIDSNLLSKIELI